MSVLDRLLANASRELRRELVAAARLNAAIDSTEQNSAYASRLLMQVKMLASRTPNGGRPWTAHRLLQASADLAYWLDTQAEQQGA